MLVHVYTASGLIPISLATAFVAAGRLREAYLAMFVAVVIDATDGSLARWANVGLHAPWIDGRKLDDIVDYLNYTFLPILLVWHTAWLPQPVWLWCAIPLITSALAFVHDGAKESDRGFFRGFPSYWNIAVFYIDVVFRHAGPWVVLAIMLGLSSLSITPVRFVYPNRPPCWKGFFLGGAAAWGAILLLMLAWYPQIPPWLTGLSLVYPILYALTSFWLDWKDRRSQDADPSI
jgi:phosphatidylcholine synthase